MNYKRLELYTGWRCNYKCTFCIEYPNMEKFWDKEVTKEEIIKKLIKYKIKGYNHVTFLGGEPFIHKVFGFAILFAQKMGYTVMVTTNASTLQFEDEAKKYLNNIDQLIISIPTVDNKKQLLINRTKSVINFDNVFINIKKYWNGNFLKINTVINKRNLGEIKNIIEYIGRKGIKEMSITYPDLIMSYYSKTFILEEIAPSYSDVFKYIKKWFDISKKYNINLILTDIPFCNIKNKDFFEKTDDFVYDNRLKIDTNNNELDRSKDLPRRRKHIKECNKCIYNKVCWGPSIHYDELYGLGEIRAIIN